MRVWPHTVLPRILSAQLLKRTPPPILADVKSYASCVKMPAEFPGSIKAVYRAPEVAWPFCPRACDFTSLLGARAAAGLESSSSQLLQQSVTFSNARTALDSNVVVYSRTILSSDSTAAYIICNHNCQRAIASVDLHLTCSFLTLSRQLLTARAVKARGVLTCSYGQLPS